MDREDVRSYSRCCRGRLIDYLEVFHGTTDHVVVYAREVVRAALERNAGAVIVARNDLTGEGTASPRDVMDARRIRSALAGAEIPLLDYLIVGREILSMAERGIL